MALGAQNRMQQWRWAFASGVAGTFLGALLGAEQAGDFDDLALALEQAFAAASAGGLLSAASAVLVHHLLHNH